MAKSKRTNAGGQRCDTAILERAIQREVPFLLIAPLLTQSRCIGTPPLPEQIELHRDRMWRRDEDLRIESAIDAERFIEDVGFALRVVFPHSRSERI